MQKIINFSFILLITISLSASELKWYDFKEAYEIAQRENKIILIDFYTDWCGWCKKMDKNTYTDQKIIEMLNQGFVAVKINPEKDGYIETPQGKIKFNQLSREIGVRSFPSTGFFTKDFKLIDVIPGYYDPENMSVLLGYMNGTMFEKISFQDYRLFNEVKKMSESDNASPKLDFILGYFYMTFFNNTEQAYKNFQSALSNNLVNKEIYAALSLTSSSPNEFMNKAKEMGYKDKSELDDLVVAYVQEFFSRKQKP